MSSLRRLHDAWTIQVGVIHALVIRELTTRFGRQNIGFLWIMVEPLLFAVLVGVIWRVTKGPEEHGVTIIAFSVTGYIPIVLFRHCVSRSVAIFTANSSLLYHKQVKIIDFILARFVVEVLGCMMAYVFIALILIVFNQFPVPADIGLFMAGWFIYALFTFSLCLIIAPLSEMSEILEKLVPVVTYIMLPFSGLFYMVSWMNPRMQEYILISPFVNGMEMMRKGIWGDQLTAHYNVWNPVIASVVVAFIGLILCRRVRRTLSVE